MERIKSLTEVRNISHTACNPDTEILMARMAVVRGKIINHVEDFMQEGGIEQPVSCILEVFDGYLRMSDYLDRLANDYEREGSEKSKEAAGEIRSQYLPTFGMLNDQFYALRILLSFIAKVGESEREANHFESMAALRYQLSPQSVSE